MPGKVYRLAVRLRGIEHFAVTLALALINLRKRRVSSTQY